MQVIVHDYETTGVNPKVCGVVQSAIWIVEFAEDGSYELMASEVALHNPGRPIPDGASEVHGIFDRDVEHLPVFTESLGNTMQQAFSEFSPAAVMGYNNKGYDDVIARRFGLPKDLLSIDMFPPMKKLKARGFMDSAKLSEAYMAMTGDEDVSQAHDAEFDLVMTCSLVKPLMQHLKVETFSEMVAKITTPVVNMDAPIAFGKHEGTPLRQVPISYRNWLLKSPDKLDMDLRASLEALRAEEIGQ